jgi:hypothetical protein
VISCVLLYFAVPSCVVLSQPLFRRDVMCIVLSYDTIRFRLLPFPSFATLNQFYKYNNRYLELADWILKDAVRSAREDNEWEQDIDANELKSGEIRFTMNKMGLHAAGAGIRKHGSGVEPEGTKAKDEKTTVVEKPKVIAYEGIPAIATKTVKAQDVYKAAQQHDNVGLELQPLLIQKQTIQETRQSP